MSTRQFTEKTPRPDPKSLAAALGRGHARWLALIEHVERAHGPVRQEWKYYSTGGWTLKVLAGKRNLFMMIPWEGSFRVVFLFGDRAVAAISRSDLPKEIAGAVESARRFAEGRGLNLPVDNQRALADVKKLIDIKVENGSPAG